MVSAALEYNVLRILNEGLGVLLSQVRRAMRRDGEHRAVQQLQHQVVLGEEIREGQPGWLDEAKIRVNLIQKYSL